MYFDFKPCTPIFMTTSVRLNATLFAEQGTTFFQLEVRDEA
jgi:hypothetical protein